MAVELRPQTHRGRDRVSITGGEARQLSRRKVLQVLGFGGGAAYIAPHLIRDVAADAGSVLEAVGRVFEEPNRFLTKAKEQLEPGKNVKTYAKLVVQPEGESVRIRNAPAPFYSDPSDSERHGEESSVIGVVKPGEILNIANFVVVEGQEAGPDLDNRWAVVFHNGEMGFIALTDETNGAVRIEDYTQTQVTIIGPSNDGHSLIGETSSGSPMVLGVSYSSPSNDK